MTQLANKKVEDTTRWACRAAQLQYCNSYTKPHFAPKDGICPYCYKDVYQNYLNSNGITVNVAKTSHITGCPHCKKSYCD